VRIEYHRSLLADRIRNTAFDTAIGKVVHKGSVVADIGAGTGLMGFLALRHGASKVYAYESAAVIDVAGRIADLNRIRSWEPIPGLSTDIIDPPKVDVVISETLGNYAFEEDIINTLNDARERHLKPGGAVIPRMVSQFACPVTAERHYQELRAWDNVGFGLDLSPARAMSLNNMYVRRLDPTDLLDGARSAVQWDRVDFRRKNRTTRSGEASWKIGEARMVYGVAVWWRAELCEGTELSTGPLDPPTHWDQLYLPVLEPFALKPGETLSVHLRSTSSPEHGTDMSWTFRQLSASGQTIEKQSLDLETGFLP